MSLNWQPAGLTNEGTFTPDKLLAKGPFSVRQIVIDDTDGVTGEKYKRGALLNINELSPEKYALIGDTEVTIALSDAELWKDDFGAGAASEYVFYTAKPPIPGTLRVVTVDQGTTTVVLDAGTDNGEGTGKGADGSFTVDYETGRVHVTFTTAPSDDDDGTVSYKYRAVKSGSALAMPKAILAEDVTDAAVIAGDVTTVAYVEGTFNEDAITNFSEGYRKSLERLGIRLVKQNTGA